MFDLDDPVVRHIVPAADRIAVNAQLAREGGVAANDANRFLQSVFHAADITSVARLDNPPASV